MTSLFDRIRQRRGQSILPPPPEGPAEPPTEVQPAADVPATAAGTDAGTDAPPTPAADATATAADADATRTYEAPTVAEIPESPAPEDAATQVRPGPDADGGEPTVVDTGLATEAALAAELPDELPSWAPRVRSSSPSLAPHIPASGGAPTSGTGGQPSGSPEGDAHHPTPEAPTPVPPPPVLGPPTSGGTPAAAPPAAADAAQAFGADAADPGARKVGVRNRGRMRRRLRYLRRVRELGYRDLGGLVFELRRARATNEVLVTAKVDALRRIDAELHTLEHGLRDYRSIEELHEPGVSVCVRCGALHGSDANFCPQCGISVQVSMATTNAVVPPPAVVDGTPPAIPTAGTTGAAAPTTDAVPTPPAAAPSTPEGTPAPTTSTDAAAPPAGNPAAATTDTPDSADRTASER